MRRGLSSVLEKIVEKEGKLDSEDCTAMVDGAEVDGCGSSHC